VFRRLVLWIAGILVAVVLVVVLAFRFSPWPSVAIIEYMFSKGDTAFDVALLRHVPPGISARINIAYGDDPVERLDVFQPEGTDQALPTIVWVHGGAWIAGSKEAVANYLKVLAGNSYTTVGIEYSTGFGSVYPKPVEQVNEALAYLVSHAIELKIDPTRIILAGDSAGAQIAAQTALIITDPGYAKRLGRRGWPHGRSTARYDASVGRLRHRGGQR